MNEAARPDEPGAALTTIRLGDLEVGRIGYGAMRLPGKNAWGAPDDPERAHRVLRRSIEVGINFIDTAWYYGPLVSNRLIAEALFPYPRDLVIATKLGAKRTPGVAGHPRRGRGSRARRCALPIRCGHVEDTRSKQGLGPTTFVTGAWPFPPVGYLQRATFAPFQLWGERACFRISEREGPPAVARSRP